MSLQQPTPPAPVVWSFTGSPMIDGLLNSIVGKIGVAVASVLVTWLAAHNFSDPNYATVITSIVTGLLLTVLSLVFTWIKTKMITKTAATQAVVAAASGTIPISVTKALTEKEMTDALNSASLIKAKAVT